MVLRHKPVIAITGSAGKSTTKEMIAAILQTKWRIFKSPGNLNYFTHTQTYAKQFNKGKYRAGVFEYGMGAPGQVRKHCLALKPDISVVTNIGTAHLGSFGGDVSKLIRAKSEIIRFMRPTGIAIYNVDDRNSRAMPHGNFKGKLLTVGVQRKANYMASNMQYGTGGMKFTVKLHGNQEDFFIPIYGTHQVYNALCAIAAADQLGFSAVQIRKGLRTFKRMQSRLAVYLLTPKTRLIDDTFSANPNAVKAAIDVVQRLSKRSQAKKIVVLGPMLALGKYTQKGHRDVGRYAAQKNVDLLYTYGKFTRQTGKAAIQNGLKSSQHQHFDSRKELHQVLRKHLGENCVILIKGSHSAQMKQTVTFLLNLSRQQTPKKKKKK